MDQDTKVRKQLKLEQWKTLIAECMASGMTVTSWCKANGIVEQTYYKNLKKLRELELEKLLPALLPVPEEKPIAFKKLEVQAPVANTQAAVVQQQFHLDPFSNSLFLFCGRHRNRMKVSD